MSNKIRKSSKISEVSKISKVSNTSKFSETSKVSSISKNFSVNPKDSDTHAIRDHSALGGSTAAIWSVCPGSVFFLSTLPPEAPSQSMMRGTQGHENAEAHLTNFLNYRINGPKKNAELPDSTNYPHKDPELINIAERYVEVLWEKVLLKSITNKAYGIEEKLTVSEKHDMYGYVDFWTVYIDEQGKRVGVVVDLKTGYHQVSAEKNPQLAFYSLALLEEIRKLGKDLDYVRAVIFQVSDATEDTESWYRETRFSINQLETWKRKFLRAAHLIFVRHSQKYKVGSHCKWCRAQAICSAYKNKLTEEQEFALMEPDVTSLPAPQSVDIRSLVKIVLAESRLTAFIQSVVKYSKALLASGNEEIAAYLKFVEGSGGRRAWMTDETPKIIKELRNLGVAKPTEEKLRGITSIESELSKLKGKSEAKNLMSLYTLKKRGLPLLVSITDERPAIDVADKLLVEEVE